MASGTMRSTGMPYVLIHDPGWPVSGFGMKFALLMASSINGSDPRDLESSARSLSLVASGSATFAAPVWRWPAHL